jgi:hypothetical protein
MWLGRLGRLLEVMGLVGGSACTRVQGEYLWATDVADSDCEVATSGAGRRRRGRGGRQQLLAEQAPCGKSTIARLGGVDAVTAAKGETRGSLGRDNRRRCQWSPECHLDRLTRMIRAVGAAWLCEHQKGTGNVAASIA